MVRPVNRIKLTESIIEAIVEYASSSNLKIGDKLPSERELSNELRVSRPLLREALRKMESLNLIEVLPGKGIFIKAPLKNDTSYLILHINQDKDKVLEILEIRRVLEKYALEEAIKNIDDGEIGELERIVNLLEEKLRRGDDSREENWAFHSIIYGSSGNGLLFDILDGFKEFHLFWEDPIKCPSFADKTYSFHRELFKGIKEKDIRRIHSVIDKLIDMIEDEVERNGSVPRNGG
ncbi:MAG: FadR family transcriptional regulator [Dictyoglomi bacterium]|jgi:DNA-binding FadR family transcriptional regulator|nr:FadR family transcriptional regulator [Dictyoglomota bacterium]HHV80960.1 FadR family transcriptional regulator [bacterium]HRU33382.1 FCD domain-containing protein [bacterium]